MEIEAINRPEFYRLVNGQSYRSKMQAGVTRASGVESGARADRPFGRFWRLTTILALISALLLVSIDVLGAAAPNLPQPQAPAASKSPLSASQKAIPIDEIGLRATEVTNLLGTFAKFRITSQDIESVRQSFPRVSAEISFEREEALRLLGRQPSLEDLQTQGELWSRRKLQLTAWLRLLTEHVTKLQGVVSQLDDLHRTWTHSRVAAQSAAVPAVTLCCLSDYSTAKFPGGF